MLISIHPKWVAKIFNGDKSAEIRRTAPKEWKDYLYGRTKIKPKPMTGYIYCTKDGERPIYLPWEFGVHENDGEYIADCDFAKGNGKVVAKFRLREVKHYVKSACKTACPDEFLEILEDSCLSKEELEEYAGENISFFAYYISDLVIFEKPMELKDFGLNWPPQSWCFVEAKE